MFSKSNNHYTQNPFALSKIEARKATFKRANYLLEMIFAQT